MDFLVKNWHFILLLVGVMAVIYFGYSTSTKSSFGILGKPDYNVLRGVNEHFGPHPRHRWGQPYRRWGWGRYHPAYVPGIYNGYIPDYDLLPVIPNGIPQCIDGDSLTPCWTIRDGAVTIMQ